MLRWKRLDSTRVKVTPFLRDPGVILIILQIQEMTHTVDITLANLKICHSGLNTMCELSSAKKCRKSALLYLLPWW